MSQRELTAAMRAELRGAHVRPVLFVECEFVSGFVRMWSGFGERVWDSKTWIGAINSEGNFIAGISGISETTEVEARGVTLTLGGIPRELISQVLDETKQGLPARIWFGFMDADGEIIADPAKVLSGAVDVPSFEEDGTTATVSISIENMLLDLRRPRERRLTDQEQQRRYPGDLGLQYVAAVQLWNGQWGRATPGIGGTAGGGGGAGSGGGGGGVGGGGGHRPMLP